MDAKDKILTKHWHVDNGGFTFSVDKYGNLEISFGFHGYSDTTVFMTANESKNEPFNPQTLANFFNEAALRYNQINK